MPRESIAKWEKTENNLLLFSLSLSGDDDGEEIWLSISDQIFKYFLYMREARAWKSLFYYAF